MTRWTTRILAAAMAATMGLAPVAVQAQPPKGPPPMQNSHEGRPEMARPPCTTRTMADMTMAAMATGMTTGLPIVRTIAPMRIDLICTAITVIAICAAPVPIIAGSAA